MAKNSTRMMEKVENDLNHHQQIHTVKVSENQALLIKTKSVNISETAHIENGVFKETKTNAVFSSIATTNVSADLTQPWNNTEDSTILADVPLSGFYSRKDLDRIINGTFIDKFKPNHQLGPDYLAPAKNGYTSNPHEAVVIKIEESGFNARKPLSLVTEMQKIVAEYKQEPALSLKKNDEWKTLTYQDYWDQIHIIAKAFIKLGLKRFHSVALLGFNSPSWFLSNFGVIFAGGLSTGIYSSNSPSACEYILKHSKTQIVLVENKQQLAKILEIRENLPLLKAIVQYTGEPTNEDVFSWDDLMKIGRSMSDEPLQKRIKNLSINQCCSLTYTSGTTGNPKAVMLNQDNLVHTMGILTELMGLDENTPKPVTVVSYLPLNHLAGQCTDMYTTFALGGHVYVAQPDALKGTLSKTLVEVKPLLFVSVPRIFEKIKEKIEESLAQMNPVKASFVKWALRKGCKYTKSCIAGSPRKPVGYKMANSVIQKIRKQLGFENTQYFSAGGAPVLNELMEFLMGLNIVLMECYGMSETTGPHIINRVETYRPGSAGKVLSGFGMKIADSDDDGNGEICMRGRNIFMGYMFDDENTRSTLDANGWVHSGDIGRLDSDNYLYITGRIKELIITAGGENVAPAPIEETVKAELPIVSQAVAIGDKQKYLTMLLTIKTTIDMETSIPQDNLSDTSIKFCRSIGSKANTVQDILKGPDMKVMNAIQEGINRANGKALSNVCRIRKWKVLPKDFSLDKEELSPTMKLKRNFILTKYKNVIDSMYA